MANLQIHSYNNNLSQVQCEITLNYSIAISDSAKQVNITCNTLKVDFKDSGYPTYVGVGIYDEMVDIVNATGGHRLKNVYYGLEDSDITITIPSADKSMVFSYETEPKKYWLGLFFRKSGYASDTPHVGIIFHEINVPSDRIEFDLNESILDRIQSASDIISEDLQNADTSGDGKVSSNEFSNLIQKLISTLTSFETEIADTGESPIIASSGLSFKGIKQGNTILDLSKIESALQYKSWIGHKHSTDAIVKGILAISRGGTGVSEVRSNVFFAGSGTKTVDSSGNEVLSAPIWRSLSNSDIPDLSASKITSGTLTRPLSVSNGTIMVDSSETTASGRIRIKLNKVDLDAQGVIDPESGSTTYNGITSTHRADIRITDTSGNSMTFIQTVVSPNGTVTGRFVARDQWGDSNTLESGIEFKANSKTNKRSFNFVGFDALDFYKNLKPTHETVGICRGTQSFDENTINTTSYTTILPPNNSSGSAQYITFDFDTDGMKFTKKPTVLISVSMDDIDIPSASKRKDYALAFANMSFHVGAVEKTGFRVRVLNYNAAESETADQDRAKQAFKINWIAVGPVSW